MSYLDTLKLNNSTFQIPDIDSIGERFRELYGSPLVASTVASMINTEKVYVYTGSETGYTSGHWYYWNGSAWTDGGVYNSSAINTDSTLSIAGMAADAKATGDEISDLKSDLGDLSELETEDKSSLVNAINEAKASGGSSDGVPSSVRQAIYNLLDDSAYSSTGQSSDLAVVQAWASTVTAISLNQSTASITGSGTVQLVATTTPTGGVVAWESSNSTIASVSSSGLVTGVSNGSVTITASSGNARATCAVTVSGFAELVSISAVYTQSGTVYATTSLDDLKSDLVVTGTYDNSTTATITNYTLSGTLTEGTSTVTVSFDGKTTTFNVTVSSAPPLYTLYQGSGTASSGNTLTISNTNNFSFDTVDNSRTFFANTAKIGQYASHFTAAMFSVNANDTWEIRLKNISFTSNIYTGNYFAVLLYDTSSSSLASTGNISYSSTSAGTLEDVSITGTFANSASVGSLSILVYRGAVFEFDAEVYINGTRYI